jgi:hypothetical protein
MYHVGIKQDKRTRPRHRRRRLSAHTGENAKCRRPKWHDQNTSTSAIGLPNPSEQNYYTHATRRKNKQKRSKHAARTAPFMPFGRRVSNPVFKLAPRDAFCGESEIERATQIHSCGIQSRIKYIPKPVTLVTQQTLSTKDLASLRKNSSLETGSFARAHI